ncbi:hypothetical protein EDB19DRAFT_189191 [Suillus lakei]|nr:hypothetical protein EDB19DRAFT_189191 [Suillus lakei]
MVGVCSDCFFFPLLAIFSVPHSTRVAAKGLRLLKPHHGQACPSRAPCRHPCKHFGGESLQSGDSTLTHAPETFQRYSNAHSVGIENAASRALHGEYCLRKMYGTFQTGETGLAFVSHFLILVRERRHQRRVRWKCFECVLSSVDKKFIYPQIPRTGEDHRHHRITFSFHPPHSSWIIDRKLRLALAIPFNGYQVLLLSDVPCFGFASSPFAYRQLYTSLSSVRFRDIRAVFLTLNEGKD